MISFSYIFFFNLKFWYNYSQALLGSISISSYLQYFHFKKYYSLTVSYMDTIDYICPLAPSLSLPVPHPIVSLSYIHVWEGDSLGSN